MLPPLLSKKGYCLTHLVNRQRPDSQVTPIKSKSFYEFNLHFNLFWQIRTILIYFLMTISCIISSSGVTFDSLTEISKATRIRIEAEISFQRIGS